MQALTVDDPFFVPLQPLHNASVSFKAAFSQLIEVLHHVVVLLWAYVRGVHITLAKNDPAYLFLAPWYRQTYLVNF